MTVTASQQATWRKRRHLYGPLLIDATGPRRRLQALGAAGHSLTAVARHTGLQRENLVKIAFGHRDTVTQRSATIIDIAYMRYADERPDNPKAKRTRTLAANHRWAPAAAWNNIDDPAETPEPWLAAGRHSSADIAAEHAHLVGFGFTDETIAARLGLKLDSLQAALRRAA